MQSAGRDVVLWGTDFCPSPQIKKVQKLVANTVVNIFASECKYGSDERWLPPQLLIRTYAQKIIDHN